MSAVSTMILNALTMTGELDSEVSSLSAGQQRYHLSRFASFIDSWSIQRNFIFTVHITSFALTTSKGSYTIGNGGDFNMVRPTRLVDPCYIRDGDGFDIMLDIIDYQAYNYLIDKDTDGSFPRYLYYDMGHSATSTGTLYFWPEPQAGLSTYLNTLQPLANVSTLSQNLIFPPGFQRAIETNYAIESAPGFIQVSQELVRIASESKAALKALNSPAPISRLDYGVVRDGGRVSILWGP